MSVFVRSRESIATNIGVCFGWHSILNYYNYKLIMFGLVLLDVSCMVN